MNLVERFSKNNPTHPSSNYRWEADAKDLSHLAHNRIKGIKRHFLQNVTERNSPPGSANESLKGNKDVD